MERHKTNYTLYLQITFTKMASSERVAVVAVGRVGTGSPGHRAVGVQRESHREKRELELNP